MNLRQPMNIKRQGGFSIIEIAIAILVFAVGMVALSYLQTSLTRSQADANARAGATNIANRIIERSRGFSELDGSTTADFAYSDINETNLSTGAVTIGNTAYNVSTNVADYRWDGTGFTCYAGEFDNANEPTGRCAAGTPTSGTVTSDMKLIEVTVTWDGADFTRQEGVAAGNLGSESVTVSSFVNSVTSGASAKVQNSGTGPILPPITYNPGNAPDIVRLGLGDDKFKESTVIEPEVVRGDIVETSWDVVTYTTSGTTSSFLRREEFTSVPCECTLRAAPTDATGKTPAIWAGDEYEVGEVTSKQIGERVSGTGSDLCDRCCRDHHDNRPGASVDYGKLFAPWRASTEYNVSGNHKHYRIDSSTGTLVEASVGQTYLEACRMVRVDGFWQVAQDVWSADRFVFPETFLDEDGEIATYSTYLVGSSTGEADATADGAVELYVNASKDGTVAYPETRPCIGATCEDAMATSLKSPTFSPAYPAPLAADSFPSWTNVVVGSNIDQQIRSRSLYIDYMSADLRALVTCLQGTDDVDTLGSLCTVDGDPGVGSVVLDIAPTSNALEIIPFYETQLTKLNSWSENPVGQFASISNEPIEDQNAHSRGVASAVALGDSGAVASIYLSNLSVLGSDQYVPTTVEPLTTVELDLRATDASGSDGGGGVVIPTNPPITGTFSRTSAVKGNIGVVVTGENANCSGDFSTGYSCEVLTGSGTARVKISGYGKGGGNPPARWACATGSGTPQLVRNASLSSSAADDPYSVFELISVSDPQPEGAGYNIIIQQTACS